MLTCVEKRNQLRAEFDRLVEKEYPANLTSPELLAEARRLEWLLDHIK